MTGRTGYDATADIADGTGTNIEDIGDVNVGATVSFLEAGETDTCVVTTSHKARCWGDNTYGQLGTGNTTNIGNSGANTIANMVDIPLTADVVRINSNNNTVCAVTEAGGGRCWGYGANGRLGTGATDNRGDGAGEIAALTDIDVEAPDDTIDAADQIVADIISTGAQTCILSTTGKVKCFGRNDTGHNGYGNTFEYGSGAAGKETPADRGWLNFGAKVVQIAGQEEGHTHESICALTETGEIYCWGENGNGQLGRGDTEDIGG